MRIGTMRPVKKVLGIIIGIAGAGFLFSLDFINNFVMDYQKYFGGVLLILAYFLVKSKSRRI